MQFDENEHNRDENGRFTYKNGSGKSEEERLTELVKKFSSESNRDINELEVSGNNAGKSKNYSYKKFSINIQLFGADYTKLTEKQLSKAQRNQHKRLVIHEEKIKKFIESNEFKKLDKRERDGRVSYWNKEIKDAKEQIELILDEMKRRKKNGN